MWPAFNSASAHRCFERRFGGVGRLTWMASSTASSCVTSCRLAPVTTSDNGTPRPPTSRWRLLPFFPPVRRIRANLLLGQRRFHHRPVNTLPAPGNAFQRVVLGQPGTPQRFEEAGLLPLQKVFVHRTGAAKAFSRERFPLATGSEHEDNGLEDHPCRL